MQFIHLLVCLLTIYPMAILGSRPNPDVRSLQCLKFWHGTNKIKSVLANKKETKYTVIAIVNALITIKAQTNKKSILLRLFKTFNLLSKFRTGRNRTKTEKVNYKIDKIIKRWENSQCIEIPPIKVEIQTKYKKIKDQNLLL